MKMKTINATCTLCGQKFREKYEEPFVGKTVKCPNCNAKYKLVPDAILGVMPHNSNPSKILQFLKLELITDC